MSNFKMPVPANFLLFPMQDDMRCLCLNWLGTEITSEKEGFVDFEDCLQVHITLLYIFTSLSVLVVLYSKKKHLSILKGSMCVVPTIPKISSLDRVSVIHKDLRLQTSACHSIKSLALRFQLSHFKECTVCAMTYAFSPDKSCFIPLRSRLLCCWKVEVTSKGKRLFQVGHD